MKPTRHLAAELGPLGIRVNCVSPGIIRTTGMESLEARAGTGSEAAKIRRVITRLTEMVPLGRIGNSQDIANVVVFLASDASRYITGQVIFVDGGWLAS